jgi:signal peptidase I
MQQQSMEPSLAPDDLLLVTPTQTYRRGDIVAFHPPPDFAADGDAPFIKRVVGLPGESVSIGDGHVTVDTERVREPYVYPGHEPFQATNATGDAHAWIVPADQVLLLGDHRANSADSRIFGPVPIATIIGRVTWRCSPSSGPVE